jgi:hypothetical protein
MLEEVRDILIFVASSNTHDRDILIFVASSSAHVQMHVPTATSNRIIWPSTYLNV